MLQRLINEVIDAINNEGGWISDSGEGKYHVYINFLLNGKSFQVRIYPRAIFTYNLSTEEETYSEFRFLHSLERLVSL